MNEDKGKFVDCIKPLFQGYWGYLRSEKESIYHDKRANGLLNWAYLALLEKDDISDNEKKLCVALKECVKTANKYADDGFDNYHKRSLIGLISGLELSIEEFMIKTLMTYEDAAYQFSNFINLEKNELKKLLPLTSADATKTFLNKLTAKARQTHKGFSQYIKLLKYWDMYPEISQQSIKLANEAKAVRNCIIHNNSVIDESAIFVSPSLEVYSNQKLGIDEQRYENYYKAANEVHSCITRASYKSEYLLSKFEK